MGRLLSEYKLPDKALSIIAAVLYLSVSTACFLMTFPSDDTLVMIVLIWIVALIGIGIPLIRPSRLEIYDDGIRHGTFWRIQNWKWTDIESIRYLPQGRVKLVHTDGKSLRVSEFSDLPDIRRQIMAHVAPVICHRAADAIERGEDVTVTRSLRVNHNGLVHKGKFIAWSDVQNVRSTKNHLVIDSPQLDTLQQRITMNMDTTPNGMFYAELIHHLWKDIPLFSPLAEPTYIVIDGVHFNSEGEMIEGS
jgi:hypothetical protein